MNTSNKATRTIAWIIVVPMALFLFLAGGTKVLGMNPLAQLEPFADWTFWIGLGEVTAATLFVLPRTSIIGALALSAHLGGAILFHIFRGEEFFGPILTSFWFQSTLLGLVWLVVWLRYPAILDNFNPRY